MIQLPSKLFPNCDIPESGDAGFYDIIPEGFHHAVNLYLSEGTVAEFEAIEKAAQFFDKAAFWNTFCRNILISFEEGSEEYQIVAEYFEFYKDEVPEVFDVEDASVLTLTEMVDLLTLESMASHENGVEQHFVVDFTLGYDQILCVIFDNANNYKNISWDS